MNWHGAASSPFWLHVPDPIRAIFCKPEVPIWPGSDAHRDFMFFSRQRKLKDIPIQGNRPDRTLASVNQRFPSGSSTANCAPKWSTNINIFNDDID